MTERLDTRTQSSDAPRHIHVFILIGVLVGIIYSNSLSNSWHFDDGPNILENKNIQLQTLDVKSLINSLYHWDNTHLNRPVTSLSFALNWFIGRDIVTGYHFINILIHILTAFFLYRVVLKLLQTERLQQTSRRSAHFIAMISAAIWATNPIHVQAITFIVQRATSLSALFSILSIYNYLLAREQKIQRQSIFNFAFCFLFFLLAFGSKENGILIPGSLILIEIIFLRSAPYHYNVKGKFIAAASLIFFLMALYFLISLFIPVKLSFDALGYEGRNFTLHERILTEPRVLLFYLSQFFYPLSSRLSLEHDITLSESLFSPWTTFPAIILIFIAIIFCFYKYKRYPLLSFAVVFYFYNHIVESTILPLEIIFEHRNYLPSFFLFVPIIAFFSTKIEGYTNDNSKLPSIINCFLVILIIVFGVGTYSRNLDWKTEKSLFIDSITKAPNQSRPYYNLAHYLLNQEKDIDGSLSLLHTALSKQSPSKHGARYQTLIEISRIYIEFKNDRQSAIPILREALSEKPDSLSPRRYLAFSLMAVGDYDEALQHIEVLLEKRPIHYKLKNSEIISRQYLLNLKSLVLLKQNLIFPALTTAKESIYLDPNDPFTLANLGFALSRTHNYLSADNYLQKCLANRPSPDLITYFLLLENSMNANLQDKSKSYVSLIFEKFTLKAIFDTLKLLSGNNTLQPADPHIILSAIEAKLKELGNAEDEHFFRRP